MLKPKLLSTQPLIKYPSIKTAETIPKGAQFASLQEDVVLRQYKTMCETKMPNQADPHDEHDLDISVTWSWNPKVLLHQLFGGIGDMSLLEKISSQIIEGKNQPALSCEFVKVANEYYKCRPNPKAFSIKVTHTPTTHKLDLFSGNIRVIRMILHKDHESMYLKFIMSHLYADATAGFALVGQIALSYNAISILSTLLHPIEFALTDRHSHRTTSKDSFTSLFLRNFLPLPISQTPKQTLGFNLPRTERRPVLQKDNALSLGTSQRLALDSTELETGLTDIKVNQLSNVQRFSLNPIFNLDIVQHTSPEPIPSTDITTIKTAAKSNVAAIFHFAAQLVMECLNNNTPVLFRIPESRHNPEGDITYCATSRLGAPATTKTTPNPTLTDYTSHSKAFRKLQSEHNLLWIPAERMAQKLNAMTQSESPDSAETPFFCDAEINIFSGDINGSVPFTLSHFIGNKLCDLVGAEKPKFSISLGNWSNPDLYNPAFSFVIQDLGKTYKVEVTTARKDIPQDLCSKAEVLFTDIIDILKTNPTQSANQVKDALKAKYPILDNQ